MRTILNQGGEWPTGKQVGITNRHLYRSSPHTSDFAASRCRHPKLIKYYADQHDVDEELRTIPNYGGMWDYYSTAGITRRDIDSHGLGNAAVASLKNKNSLSQ